MTIITRSTVVRDSRFSCFEGNDLLKHRFECLETTEDRPCQRSRSIAYRALASLSRQQGESEVSARGCRASRNEILYSRILRSRILRFLPSETSEAAGELPNVEIEAHRDAWRTDAVIAFVSCSRERVRLVNKCAGFAKVKVNREKCIEIRQAFRQFARGFVGTDRATLKTVYGNDTIIDHNNENLIHPPFWKDLLKSVFTRPLLSLSKGHDRHAFNALH